MFVKVLAEGVTTMSTGALVPAVRPAIVHVTTGPTVVHGPEGLSTESIFNPGGTTSVNVSGLLAGPLSVTVEASSARPPAMTVFGCTVVVTALSSVATTVAATLAANGPLPPGATISPELSTSVPKRFVTSVRGGSRSRCRHLRWSRSAGWRYLS